MSDTVEERLYWATEEGDLAIVLSLLRDHPDLNVNWANNEYDLCTALHIATYSDHAEMVKLLSAHPNINVNLKNTYGSTPFSLGCLLGHESVVGLLLKDPRVVITLGDNDGCTPLWSAARNAQRRVLEWLIASGRDLGDVNVKRTMVGS